MRRTSGPPSIVRVSVLLARIDTRAAPRGHTNVRLFVSPEKTRARHVYLGRDAGGRLERVDVLREAAQQLALLVQQPQERVRRRRPVLAGPELLREPVERGRALADVSKQTANRRRNN